MSNDVKSVLTLGGGGLIVAVILGGGWMWWSEGNRRSALSADLTTWTTAVASYERCMVGEQPTDTEHILLSMAAERTRDSRCHIEHLAGIAWSDDEAIGPLKSAVAALVHGDPANLRMSGLDADQTCKQLAAVTAELKSLQASISETADSAPPVDCALLLKPLPLLIQPPADPQAPGIRKGALREVALRGDRVFAGYRMARQGVLAWKAGDADWEVVANEQEMEGVYWGGDHPWGIVPDPEAPTGMIRYRVIAWTGSEWMLRTALPDGLVPHAAVGPGGDFAVISGMIWLATVRNLRAETIDLLPMSSQGQTIGEPIVLMAMKGEHKPTLQFSEDGALLGMVLADNPTGWTFLASHIAPGATTATTSRVFLPVDVPDAFQSDTITACGDGENRYALAADRWLLKGSDGGTDWKIHHTFETPMRRAELACRGDQVAILADFDGAREAVELHYAICDAAACPEPIPLGEQQADGRSVVFDDDGVRLLSVMLGHAVIFHDVEGVPVPEHIFSTADRPDDALPILAVDGRLYAIRTGE